MRWEQAVVPINMKKIPANKKKQSTPITKINTCNSPIINKDTLKNLESKFYWSIPFVLLKLFCISCNCRVIALNASFSCAKVSVISCVRCCSTLSLLSIWFQSPFVHLDCMQCVWEGGGRWIKQRWTRTLRFICIGITHNSLCQALVIRKQKKPKGTK